MRRVYEVLRNSDGSLARLDRTDMGSLQPYEDEDSDRARVSQNCGSL